MISTYNLTKLNSLLKDFFTLTHIRITVFDETFRELAAYPADISHFCRVIRTDKTAELKCRQCDKHACETASGRRSPYIYRCHAGLTECIAPLSLGNIVIGYLFFGQAFAYENHEEGWKAVQTLCRSYQLDWSDLKQACREQPVISEDYISSASNILMAVASYLCMERMAIIRHKELPVQIDEYILAHFTEDISVSSICQHFQIGKTYLYEIGKQSYGMGIAEYIRGLRLEKARTLLIEQPELHIDEIASCCGFNDYNYFITMFKREFGMPPKRLRLTYQKEFKKNP